MAEVISASEGTRPAVIFGVDGVLRVDTETKPKEYVRHPIYPVFSYNPGLRKPLSDLLAKADGYYIGSSRAHSHSHIGAALLLPELDWINDDSSRKDAYEVSERALAIAGLFGNRPVAWADDEIGGKDYEWAEQRSAPTLLVRTESDIGLTPRQSGLIESWCTLL